MTGIIDTVKLTSNIPLKSGDDPILRQNGFAHSRNFRVVEVQQDKPEQVTIRDFYYNERTGVRVFARPESVQVEGSLPRVLGLTNDQQEQLAESDVMTAFDAMTHGIIPHTAEAAPFALSRLDLARNFNAPVSRVVSRYAQLKHPSVRSAPRLYFDESVSYFGTVRELVIYDKGKQMKRNNDDGNFGRVEGRWMGMKGMTKFIEAFGDVKLSWSKSVNPTLPFFVKWGRDTRVVHVGFTNESLNSVLCADVASIGRLKPVPALKDLNELLFFACKENPEYNRIFQSILKSMTGPRRRRYQAAYRAYLESDPQFQEVDLVNLIWRKEAA